MCSARPCSPSGWARRGSSPRPAPASTAWRRATAAALLGLECVVYMGEEDTRRQALNVARMRLLGAEVVPVTTGSRTLKDAINEAMRDWVTNVDTTHYLLGTVAGPHPFPTMVRDFHRVIGDEARAQVLELTGRLPDVVAACVGGGSNAIGHLPRLPRRRRRRAARPRGRRRRRGDRAGTPSSITGGAPGVLHGNRTYRAAGRGRPDDRDATRSPPAWTTPGSGPEHAWLPTPGGPGTSPSPTPRRWRRSGCSAAPRGSSRRSRARTRWPGRCASGRRARARTALVLVNLSGRGDKDVDTAARWFGLVTDAATSCGPRSQRVVSPLDGEAAGERRPTLTRSVRGAIDDGAGRGPGRAGRLPAGRLPDRRRLGAPRCARWSTAACDVLELGAALLRPADGRAGHPGGRRRRAARPASGPGTSSPRSSRWPPPGAACWS